ncbi:heptaprenyl diphosphate synthase component 1 [Salisediminibacterium halotolerans]|uniref:Heptaprenyl diphosphate synthase (HEPPP synthase) subunit 1 n=1 Tax=Salisediminibacterium halotolerans TaxID=517425 RepID=A0A1H9P3P4_9BACI|nr:heptaprenyl diphosphate synthase component 1 [Salisediminibacterium haloalkalitolerans]SER42731.1 Heptaprenyl diphosphate synthase (HEPPP synthase) subunit 1 [Salisediminibacterium haloalkalitolerans]
MTVNHHENSFVHNVVHSFGESVSHRYLEYYIGKPPVNEDHVLVLFRMLKHTGKSDQEIHQLILTTLLVQSALDTHEKVIKHGLGTPDIKTEQQLTVLGGDFYSSLYYYILSRSGDASVIRALAKGIQDINEAKMSIYRPSAKQPAAGLTELATLYSALAVRLAEVFELNAWVEPLRSYFLIQGLQADYNQLEYSGTFGLAALNYKNKVPHSVHNGSRTIAHAISEAVAEEYCHFEMITAHNGIEEGTFPPLFYPGTSMSDAYKKTCAAEEG